MCALGICCVYERGIVWRGLPILVISTKRGRNELADEELPEGIGRYLVKAIDIIQAVEVASVKAGVERESSYLSH